MHVLKREEHNRRLNKNKELKIMVDYIKPHLIGITESWANNDVTDAELGLEGYVMFRKDRMGRREEECYYTGGIYCNEAIWCKLVTGHTTVTLLYLMLGYVQHNQT